MARERAAGSEMAANADGGCNVLESCAEAETDTAPAMQHSNDRLALHWRAPRNRFVFVLD